MHRKGSGGLAGCRRPHARVMAAEDCLHVLTGRGKGQSRSEERDRAVLVMLESEAPGAHGGRGQDRPPSSHLSNTDPLITHTSELGANREGRGGERSKTKKIEVFAAPPSSEHGAPQKGSGGGQRPGSTQALAPAGSRPRRVCRGPGLSGTGEGHPLLLPTGPSALAWGGGRLRAGDQSRPGRRPTEGWGQMACAATPGPPACPPPLPRVRALCCHGEEDRATICQPNTEDLFKEENTTTLLTFVHGNIVIFHKKCYLC